MACICQIAHLELKNSSKERSTHKRQMFWREQEREETFLFKQQTWNGLLRTFARIEMLLLFFVRGKSSGTFSSHIDCLRSIVYILHWMYE